MSARAQRLVLWVGPGLGIWLAAYLSLPFLAAWVSRDVFRLDPGVPLASAVEFFLYEAPKVLLLLVVVVFGVGVVRSFFTAERTRAMLARLHEAEMAFRQAEPLVLRQKPEDRP